MFGKTKIEDLKREKIVKKVSVGDGEILITIDSAFTGVIKGKKEILDEILIDNMIEAIANAVKSNKSKYNPIPSEIAIRTNYIDVANNQTAENSDNVNINEAIIESFEPRFELSQVVLNSAVKEKIKVAISAVKHRKFMSEEWGLSEHFGSNRAIILNFYGKPGTGKSMAAEAIAKELGKKVYHINYSDLESKYVGETPKNIKKAFERATKDDALLIFDEADSFLGKRLTSVTASADYGVNITRSVLLMELEKFTGVVIFTTNLIKNYDEAFKRRILLSVCFEMPDEESRKKIWELQLGTKVPLAQSVKIDVLSKRYEQVSGADIRDMVFYAALDALEKDEAVIPIESFDRAYEVICERYKDDSADITTRVISTEKISEEQFIKETKGD